MEVGIVSQRNDLEKPNPFQNLDESRLRVMSVMADELHVTRMMSIAWNAHNESSARAEDAMSFLHRCHIKLDVLANFERHRDIERLGLQRNAGHISDEERRFWHSSLTTAKRAGGILHSEQLDSPPCQSFKHVTGTTSEINRSQRSARRQGS